MDIKTISEVIESVVKVAAIIIGGGWAYWKFVMQRAREPATDLDIGVNFVGKQDAKWIIEITVTLENKSFVRLTFEKDFQIKARYLLADDNVVDSDQSKLNHQLHANRTIDERIHGKPRYFTNVEYINPKQLFRQRYITFIPGDATFLWITTKFYFKLKGKEQVNSHRDGEVEAKGHPQGKVMVNSQRIFRVPNEEVPTGLPRIQ